jgi:hypothetical protein
MPQAVPQELPASLGDPGFRQPLANTLESKTLVHRCLAQPLQ